MTSLKVTRVVDRANSDGPSRHAVFGIALVGACVALSACAEPVLTFEDAQAQVQAAAEAGDTEALERIALPGDKERAEAIAQLGREAGFAPTGTRSGVEVGTTVVFVSVCPDGTRVETSINFWTESGSLLTRPNLNRDPKNEVAAC